MSLEHRWQEHLRRLREAGRHRALAAPRGLDFSSNDYLGRASLPSLDGDPRQGGALARSGTASRLLRGQHPIWDEVEAALADWHGAQAALVLGSGYVANEGLLATVIERDDVAFSDEANHASIIDGLRLSGARKILFRHNDLEHLERGLAQAARDRLAGQQLFVVTESLFGMEADRAPLPAICDLADRFEARVIVDEAHATGCFGESGSGLVDALGLRRRVLATMHTGGKALAVPGAYVCGSPLLREYLVNRCRKLIFSTAPPPLVGSWWLESLAWVKGDPGHAARRRLQENAGLFRDRLRELGLPSPGCDYLAPILVGADAMAVASANALQEQGFDVRAIRPPTVPEGTARLRISIHADHSAEALTALARAVARLPG